MVQYTGGVEFAYSSSQEEHEAKANEKQQNFDQIHADNIVKQSRVGIHRKKYKKKI
jgi:hypothetical protein